MISNSIAPIERNGRSLCTFALRCGFFRHRFTFGKKHFVSEAEQVGLCGAFALEGKDRFFHGLPEHEMFFMKCLRELSCSMK